MTTAVPAVLSDAPDATGAGGVLPALRRAAVVAGALGAWLVRIVWRVIRPYIAVVSPVGWLVLFVAAISIVLSIALGWEEFFFLGVTLLVALVVAVGFVFGRSTYAVEVELTPRRVVAGERAVGRMLVRNVGSKRVLPTRMELRVGEGTADFAVPMLQPNAEHEELFAVPTERRAVIDAGPAVSVRGDQLGLLRRTVKWTDVIELFVHPVTVNLAPSAAGLVRDLEGQVSKKITDNDISFHALRPYVPGDDRRYVHWRTSARTGQLMVRQFEETRRSQLTIIHSTSGGYYASPEEFELAVSITASIGAQVVRDGTQMSVVSERLALRTHSAMSLLDDTCRLQQTRKTFPSARHFAREVTRRLPSPSVVIIVSGSAMQTSELRSIKSLFPSDTTVLAVRAQPAAVPKLATIAGITVLTIGALIDLPGGMKRSGS